MDTSSILVELSGRASRYSISLNGQIDLNSGKNPLHGSTALVYQGVLRRDRTKIAVKVFRSAPSGEVDALKRICREVHLWSKLRHENIVRLLGISTEFGSTISIVSDWLEMGDAHTYVQNKENDPRPLFMDIATGLHYLHSHALGPIFHGDLKGLNVLVSDDCRGLLSDFGLSSLTTSTLSMTVDLPRGGSLPWMAPELLDDYGRSSEGDVWAFGMTILELFTRLPPFHEQSHVANIMYRILQRKLPVQPSEESTCFRMTNAWWNICLSCWNYDPTLRPTVMALMKSIKMIMSLEGNHGSIPVVCNKASGVVVITPTGKAH
ncbi:kinase-like domain-containing protein [Scleroderma citrinum]